MFGCTSEKLVSSLVDALEALAKHVADGSDLSTPLLVFFENKLATSMPGFERAATMAALCSFLVFGEENGSYSAVCVFFVLKIFNCL